MREFAAEIGSEKGGYRSLNDLAGSPQPPWVRAPPSATSAIPARGSAALGQQLSRLVREIDHERARLHEGDPGIAVDNGGDAVVGADRQKLRLELLVLADVDGVRGIGQA